MSKLDLFYSAPICKTGYGYTGLNFYKNLVNDPDVKINTHPIGQLDESLLDIDEYYNKNIPISIHSTSLRLWHQHDVHTRIGSGHHFGFPIFELDTFTQQEKYSMSLCDSLIVCSEWAKKIVLNYVSKDVHVVPLGVDTSIFKPVETASRIKKTIFLCAGKWEIRKGHDIAIHAFKSEFDKNENVELWMMCNNPFLNQGELDEWLRLCNHPNIKVIPKAETQDDLAYLMSKADVGVFVSRAEGWNLELLEMMAMGKHVIATDYSAHTEFCNDQNCRLIPITHKELAIDGKWFFGQGYWAKLGVDQVDHIRVSMRELHEQKKNGSLGVNISGVLTGQKFDWKNSTDILKSVLCQIK